MDLMLASGEVAQRIPFYVGTTGLASGFSVRRQRGTAASAAMTTPDIVEDASVAGLYRLLLDEDTTITSGKSTEAMILVISHAALALPVVLTVMLYESLRSDIHKINGSPVNGSGTPGDKWTGT